ncbi:MAG: YfhO family protein [Chloroflexi bacterium]|nr:YfhO family protein [Chloroflexota bacterium]
MTTPSFLSHLRRSAPRWSGPLALLLLPFLWLWRLAFAGQVLYWGLPLQQFAAWYGLAAAGWLAGAPPLWNRWLGAGAPLLANHQSAALYPLNLPFLFLPVERAMGLQLLMHLALAGLGMYTYSGRLRLTPPARTLSALAFAFGGYVIARVNFPSMTCALAWVPWVLWAVHRLVQRPSAARLVGLAALAALQALAGHVQLWYYTLWLGGLYTLALAWAEHPGEPVPARLRAVARAVGWLAGAVAAAVCLSAGQMLPTAELAAQSHRSGGAELGFAMTYSLWPWRLIAFAVPDFFGNPGRGDFWGYSNYWEDAVYIGLLPLGLALYAVRFGRRRGSRPAAAETGQPDRRLTPFFVGLAVASVLLALGKNLPLYPWVFRWVPGFGFFQAPSRLLLWYVFAAAALAGIGWDLLGPSPRLARAARLLAVASVGVALAAGLTQWFLPQVRQTFSQALLQASALGLGACLLVAWRAGASRPPRGWALAALTLAAADLFLFSLPLIPTTDAALYRQPTESAAFLQAQPGLFRIYTTAESDYDLRYKRYSRFGDFRPHDVEFLMGLRETQLPNMGVLEQMESAGHFDPLLIGRYQQYMAAVKEAPVDAALRLLGLLNVRYLLEPAPLAGLTAVHQGEPVSILENPHAMPRAWVAPRARVIDDPAEVLQALGEPTFDPRAEVLLEAPAPLPSAAPQLPTAPAETAPVLRDHPNGVTIALVLAEPGYLCLSQTYYPGWQALVDGAPARLVRGNFLLQVVPLPAGPHTVELRYRPLSFWGGAALGAAAWAACAGWVLWRRRRARRQNGEDGRSSCKRLR